MRPLKLIFLTHWVVYLALTSLLLPNALAGGIERALNSQPVSGDPRTIENPSPRPSPAASIFITPAPSPSLPAYPPPSALKPLTIVPPEATNCSQDIPKFCDGLQWGEGMASCLRGNQPKLSAACRTQVAVIAKKLEHHKEVRQSCQVDAHKFCATVGRGQGRILSCLKENEPRVSQVCRARLQSLDMRGTS